MPASKQSKFLHASLNATGSGYGKNPDISRLNNFNEGTSLSSKPKRVRRPSGIESRAVKAKISGLSGAGMSRSANKGDRFGY
jgi:hypothetical protein